MNHEQFYWWVLGYVESNPNTFWSNKIRAKAMDVDAIMVPTPEIQLFPEVPTLPDLPEQVDELESFMNFDNIPIEEEELPAVGSDIDTEAEWVPSKGKDVREVHGTLDKESGIDTSGEWDKASQEVLDEVENMLDDDGKLTNK